MVLIAIIELKLYINCLRYEAGLTHENDSLEYFHECLVYNWC